MAWITSAEGARGALPSRATRGTLSPRSPRCARLALALSLGLPACTEFAPAADVDVGITQEMDLLEVLPETWRCIENAPAPSAGLNDPMSGPRVVRSLQLVGFVGSTDLSGTTVRACSVRDPACMSPVTPAITPAADGWVDVPLFEGFDGYLEITSPGAVPSMLFYGQPLTADGAVDPEPAFLVEMETALTFDRLFLGREAFPNTGVINIRALDCQNAPAPGVQFQLEPSAVGWYYVGEIPVATAEATTESGVGGFSDVGPGTVVVTARIADNGLELAPPKSVFVRGGWFTNIRFRH